VKPPETTTPEEPAVKFKIEETNIVMVPGVTLTEINENATGEVKTGGKIKVDDKEYTVVVLGDINGDGSIDTGDTFKLKQALMEVKEITDESQKVAADINVDGSIDTGDSFILKKHINEVEGISIK